MALIHSTSLERWQEWERSHHRARRVKHLLADLVSRRRGDVGAEDADAGLVLHRRPDPTTRPADVGEGRILVAVDSASPTSRASLLTIVPYLRSGLDVLAPADLQLPEVDGWEHEEVTDVPAQLRERNLETVVSLGQHLRAGFEAHHFARYAGIRSVVVQHGAITPFAPPLPRECELMAWSAADGDFYRSGREDVQVSTTGSQLLWQARRESASATAQDGEQAERPVFLGQLHGVELPRRVTFGTAYSFCRETGALYRPHPSETDLLSRRTHDLMRRRGIELADASVPLREMPNPVVGIFSTGVLEAAVRGVPSWVHAERAPQWLPEFWVRYGMHRWGSAEPTPAPPIPDQEPAVTIAEMLEGSA